MNIDWSKAPEGATGHAQIILEGTIYNLWIFNEEYAYTDRPEDRYTFGGEDRSVRFLNKREELQNICSRPSPTPWTGEGLPPVGTVCELKLITAAEFGTAEIMYSSKTALVWRWEGLTMEFGSEWGGVKIRPIQTAEQIAAEERARDIGQLRIDSGIRVRDGAQEIAVRLYDAGYRKQEPTQ